MAVVLVIASGVVTQSLGAAAASGREIFADAAFERGFLLTAASHPAPKLELGALQTTQNPASQPPAWRMPQWASRYLLEPGACTTAGENVCIAETPGKRIAVDRSQPGHPCLRLEVLGISEYAGHARVYGEPWPHLLIEQTMDEPVRVGVLKQLIFAVEMRIPYCKPAPGVKPDPSLHTAQVSAFWTVHNLTPGSPDYKDMIWFGIPFFDARWDVPGPHYAIDSGKDDASQKFICLLDGKRFWNGPTGDGQWRPLTADLCALIREGLAISHERGHLTRTRFEDLAITSFNLGWEVPGPYDAALEIRDLSMKAFD